MATPTISQITSDIQKVLPIYDTTLYQDQLNILVQGAMSKLENEGVGNVFDYMTPLYYDYITCLRYQVACDMDLDIDIERLREQYVTRVNTLRCSLSRQ